MRSSSLLRGPRSGGPRPPQHFRSAYARLVKRVIVLLGILLIALTAPGLARAHSDLESTSPADGERLSAAPTELTFVFSEELLPDFVNFVAVDAAEQTTELTVTGVHGATAVIAWPAALPGGEWRVEYRVVSQDGHPVNGHISFSYPAVSPSPSPSSASPAPTATPTPTPTSASPAPQSSSAAPSPSASPAADESPTSPGWMIALIAVGILVIIAIVGLVARRRTG